MSRAPLSGITVIELGHYIAGPLSTQILADHGARVIKVEPMGGEAARSVFPIHERESAYYAAVNRGKESVTLDLKLEEDMRLFEAMLASADAFVTNYRIATLEKLQLTQKRLFEINPQLVFVPISGYGLDGPLADRPAFDGAIQAASGLMHVTGERGGQPLRSGLFVPDHVAGMHAAFAVLMGVQARLSSEVGGVYDISMLDVTASMHLFNFSLVEQFGESPTRMANASLNTFSDVFEGSDGFVYIAAVTDAMWSNLCEVMDRAELAEPGTGYPSVHDRRNNYDYLVGAVQSWAATKSIDEMQALLLENNIPFAPIATVDEVLENEQLRHRGKFIDVKYNDESFTTFGPIIPTPAVPSHHVGSAGECNESIREEFGSRTVPADVFS
ncbi:CaiB/BaiF CoA-transferase family protein [Rhodococcus sp. ARC_M5]|uniref:CaiB/BaiF CoA transferase family protein n=1 Tax=Rhodococcus sp. ARC_M5 TaxID=2928851 RepID=UPI001FB38E54|nr:CoA transferase [Rhodococcus sp. ARC_M5]MCJ0893805.1 CoA transferase [Rhodococcus sp. ARC_M5]